jgi:hypothetical protein
MKKYKTKNKTLIYIKNKVLNLVNLDTDPDWQALDADPVLPKY